jgi:hypothetical protein
MGVRARVGELIGGGGRLRIRQINGLAPTRDFSTADYRFWDKARRAKARGLEISGLLLKPLGSKAAAWVMGDAPEWTVEARARHASTLQDGASEVLNGWWARNHSEILRGYEEALNLGDAYLVINADMSVTVLPPQVVEPLLDGAGQVVGWRITERTEGGGERAQHAAPLRNGGVDGGLLPGSVSSTGTAGGYGAVKIVDEYTAQGRVRRIERGGVVVSTECWANLIGRVPVVHIANRYGADEFYGRPEGDALIPILQRYGDVLDAAIRGNIRQGRPTPVIERMGTAEQVKKFWEKFGRRETHSLPDGSTEAVDVIDFDPDQLLTLGGDAQFKYAAPGAFSGDTQTLLGLLFYLVVQHSEIPEAVWGASIPSSRASAETQMEPFVKWIGKKRGLAEDWLLEVARVALAYLALMDWRIEADAPLSIGWRALTAEDGRLALDTASWAHGAGIIDDEGARRMLGISG